MWKIGKRNLPVGINFAEGPDWFCAHHSFVAYIVRTEHEYVHQLIGFLNNSIMAPEVN